MNQQRHRTAVLIVTLAVLLVSFGWAHAQETAASTSVNIAKIFAGDTPDNVADLKAMEAHIKALTAKVTPSTVGVQVGNAQGSGVIVSRDGYVLTAAHVSGKPGRDVTIILHDGRTVQGKTLGLNREIDAGLMKITTAGNWPFLQMGDSSKLKDGQWIIGTGHPNGYQSGRKPVLRLGRVLANHASVIVTDCTLVSGDSGGPLFDMDGKVIGIHSRIDSPLTSNMHVPANTYKETWDRLIDGEEWGWQPGRGPYIGVQGDPDAEDATVAHVYQGTPAAKAGIKSGDVIQSFDGKRVENFPMLAEFVRNKKPGDVVKIQVLRGERTVTLDVIIGRRGRE